MLNFTQAQNNANQSKKATFVVDKSHLEIRPQGNELWQTTRQRRRNRYVQNNSKDNYPQDNTALHRVSSM